MAPFKPLLQHRFSSVLSVRVVLRASFVVGAFAATLATAADERAQSGRQGQSYLVDVPVVSAKAIEETRTVERPEKTCERVSQSGYRQGRSDDYSRNYRQRYEYDRNSDYQRRRDRRGGVGAQILGGLIGGAIGNQFGGGKGKKALTIAGALFGSSIARSRGERDRSDDDRYYSRQRNDRDWEEREFQPEYQCRTTTITREVTQVAGYDVTYRYNNTLYKRRMDYDPGDTLELRVRAVPDVAPTVADS